MFKRIYFHPIGNLAIAATLQATLLAVLILAIGK